MLEASVRGVFGVLEVHLAFEGGFVRFVGDLVVFEGDFGIVLVFVFGDVGCQQMRFEFDCAEISSSSPSPSPSNMPFYDRCHRSG
jgi:hypothetical protein